MFKKTTSCFVIFAIVFNFHFICIGAREPLYDAVPINENFEENLAEHLGDLPDLFEDMQAIDELTYDKGKVILQCIFLLMNFVAAGSKMRGARLGLEDMDRAITGNTDFIDSQEWLVASSQVATLLTHGLSTTLSSTKVIDAIYLAKAGVRPITGEATRTLPTDSKKTLILKRLGKAAIISAALYLTFCYLVEEGEKTYVNNGCTSDGSCEPLWEQVFWEITTLSTHGFDAIYSNLILVDGVAQALAHWRLHSKKELTEARIEAMLHNDGEIDEAAVQQILQRNSRLSEKLKNYSRQTLSAFFTAITLVPTYSVKFIQTFNGFDSFVKSEGLSAALSASAVLSMAPMEASQPFNTIDGAISLVAKSKNKSSDFNRVHFHTILQFCVLLFSVSIAILAMPDAIHSSYKALDDVIGGMIWLLYSFVSVYAIHSMLSSTTACSKIIYQGCATAYAKKNDHFRELWTKFRALSLKKNRPEQETLHEQGENWFDSLIEDEE